MSTDELYDLLNAWVREGEPNGPDLARLKEEYLHQLGLSACTSCPDWKHEMFMYFRQHFKLLNRPIMSAINKYMIKPEIGSLHVANLGNLVNGPVKTPGNTPLTDKIAEDLFKLDEGYKEYIIVNPDYKAPEPDKKKEGDGK
ncbi:hypothetical protein GCM10028807_32680 [Spirosoma daeguense]